MRRSVVVLLLATTAACGGLFAQGPDRGTAQNASLSNLDSIMKAAVARGTIPGGVVLVGHDGEVVYRKAFGMRSLEPAREAMTVDTIFDIASLTKCLVTSTAVMQLVEQGKLRLNDPVAAYLPEFARNGKDNITLRALLTHFSGLPEDLDLKTRWRGREAAYRMAMDSRPVSAPGTRFLYSDINFIVLGFVVEKVSGLALDEYAERNIFQPLGMRDTRYLPPEHWRFRIAPTEYGEGHRIMRGTVHDPTAERMGGVAGHAGVFSTADDLAKFAQAMLHPGKPNSDFRPSNPNAGLLGTPGLPGSPFGGFHLLSEETVKKMTTPQQPPGATVLRGLGWDIDSPFSSARGEFFPVGSFGHTGFTGTSMWIDPVTDSYVILLTNAVHPKGARTAEVVSLRARIASAVAQGLRLTASEEQMLRLSRITGYNEALGAARLVTSRNGHVRTGIDVLESNDFAELRRGGRTAVRVALVTNQTGVDSEGRRTIDILAKARGVELAAIFSPEHGVSGSLDTTAIADSRDAATGVPVYSVYGDTDAKRRPSPQVLQSVDVVVFDIQDIGTRFYTYETTLGYFLEAAARAGNRIVVLDRPDPINGASVQGPVSDAGRESFTNYGTIPVRHGMTMGELARYYNGERGIRAQLTVVAMEGWLRGDWFDSTGVLWVNPSPNMRSLTAATLYPGVGLVEGTNVSVGRGTGTPFELVGAPWIAAWELAQFLNARAIPGVRFVPTEFTPASDVYAQKKCGGVNIVVTDRNALDAPELGVEIASALHALYPTEFDMTKLDKLLVNAASAKAISEGVDPRRIAMEWDDGIARFRAERAKYLLY